MAKGSEKDAKATVKVPELTEEDTGRLLEELQKYPWLYEVNHNDFHKRDCRNNAWSEIATQFEGQTGKTFWGYY